MDHSETEAGTPTLEQWARAKAVKAVLSATPSGQVSLPVVAIQVEALAALIITGRLPEPRPGTYYG
jgi:hypothetical protein